MAEQLSAAGVPVFLADVKGDLSGLGAAGRGERPRDARARATPATPGHAARVPGRVPEPHRQARRAAARDGVVVRPAAARQGARPERDADQRARDGLQVLRRPRPRSCSTSPTCAPCSSTSPATAPPTSTDYGGMSKATVGVLLREMVELEQQGALAFFGEPEFDLDDLLQVERDGRGLVTVLELSDVQDKPALFSTFMMWMLARLYATLPEVGDLDKPKLVFFFDEAHLLFDGASKAFLEQVAAGGAARALEGRRHLLRHAEPEGRSGRRARAARQPRAARAARVHARRREGAAGGGAHLPRRRRSTTSRRRSRRSASARRWSRCSRANGAPTPPFATRLIPPASRMGPLTDAELAAAARDAAGAPLRAGGRSRERAREARARRSGGSAACRRRPRGRARAVLGGPRLSRRS